MRACSSMSTMLNSLSAPEPPYSSGMLMQRKPFSPAFFQTDLSA